MCVDGVYLHSGGRDPVYRLGHHHGWRWRTRARVCHTRRMRARICYTMRCSLVGRSREKLHCLNLVQHPVPLRLKYLHIQLGSIERGCFSHAAVAQDQLCPAQCVKVFLGYWHVCCHEAICWTLLPSARNKEYKDRVMPACKNTH